MNQDKIKEYENRLAIPITGLSEILFYTKNSKNSLAVGYSRIVICDRGPYIEFERFNINFETVSIPKDKEWKLTKKYIDVVDYIEYRTQVDNVKIYDQKKTVDYADYEIGKFYIDPCDLYLMNGIRILVPKREKKK